MPESPTDLMATRRSLLQRLKDVDDNASWEEFVDTYEKLIIGVARKSGLGEAEAQDVVQETFVVVARKMPDFDYDPSIGRFRGWLMQVARSRIIDQVRKRYYEKAGQRLPREMPLGTEVLEQQPNPSAFDLEAVWNEEWHRHIRNAALKKVKERVKPQQYQVFYLHVIKGVPAKEVAQKLKVELPTVYYARSKLGRQLRKEIKALERRLL